jgi:hypothetical protein
VTSRTVPDRVRPKQAESAHRKNGFKSARMSVCKFDMDLRAIQQSHPAVIHSESVIVDFSAC